MSSNKLAESGVGRRGGPGQNTRRPRGVGAWGGCCCFPRRKSDPARAAVATSTAASDRPSPAPRQRPAGPLAARGVALPSRVNDAPDLPPTVPGGGGDARVGSPPVPQSFGIRCLYHKSLVGTRKQVD